jgi:Ca2+-binding RTX toxin-like protein
MQSLYGLSTTTRTGNTTYGFNANASRDIFDASLTPGVAYTVFDSGGIDTLDYSGFGSSQLIDLNPERFMNVGSGVGNVAIARGVTIENAVGGTGDDRIVGNGANNVLDGRAGIDTLSYETATAGVTVDLTSTTPQDTGGAGIDTLRNFENLTGSAFDDVLTGQSGATILSGGSGNDVLDGGAGADTMAGGAGNDTYFVDDAGDVVSESPGEGTDIVHSSVSFTADGDLENLTLIGTAAINGTGNSLANVIRGNNSANVLDGGIGNDTLIANNGDDTLIGGAGNDTLSGGLGADAMSGGSGNDTYNVDNVGDLVIENAAEGTDTVVSTIDYALTANVENLSLSGAALAGTGNSLANAIRGTDGNNVLDGGAGADKLYGYAGDDTYHVDTSSDRTAEIPGGGNDTVIASTSYRLFSYIENLTLTGTAGFGGTGNVEDNVITGNSGANSLLGLEGSDTLIGNGGNDWLDGGLGADTMTGGTGSDTYTVDNALDSVTENAGEGTDLVRSRIDYTLGANVENLTFLGTADLDGTGNDLANALRGNAGDNVLDGGAGADKLYGYGGNDTFIIDNAGDGIAEAAGGGTDTAMASVSYSLAANVENLTLTGSANIDGTGNGLDNVITGNAGANTLSGGLGADLFVFDGVGASDTIADFSRAQGDRIDLHLADANSALGGDQAFAFVGTSAFSHTAGELRYEQSGGATFVYGDTNGDGAADFALAVAGLTSFVASDFVL